MYWYRFGSDRGPGFPREACPAPGARRDPRNSVKPKGITYGSEVYGWDRSKREKLLMYAWTSLSALIVKRGPVPPSDSDMRSPRPSACTFGGMPLGRGNSVKPKGITYGSEVYGWDRSKSC